MIELALFGRSSDAQSIVLTGPDGERYSVAITDALRAAVRRVSPSEPDTAPEGKRPLRPREIQALLREGLSAPEIAEREGMDVDDITKYEAPVLAERAWAVSRAQLCRIGGAQGSPILEDLVVNRLAARGVDSETLSWSAARRPGANWEVYLTFVQGGVERQASWTLSSDATSVQAIDEEATWLTEAAAPPAPVSAFFPVPTLQNGDTQAMEDLIDKANALRGRPALVVEEYADEFADLEEATSSSSPSGIPVGVADVVDAPATVISLGTSEIHSVAQTGSPESHAPSSHAPSSPAPGGSPLPAVPGIPAGSGIPTDSAAQADSGSQADSAAPGISGRRFGRRRSSEAPPSAPGAETHTPGTDALGPEGAEAGDSGAELFAFSNPPSADGTAGQAPAPRRSKNRRPVPSWDEIVFGSKTD